MNGTDIALTIIGVLGTLSSILFAFLAFKRNDKKDTYHILNKITAVI